MNYNKAVIYVRVSTDEQAKKGYSIDMQQSQCLNFAVRSNYQVTNIYIDDGYTAKNMKRPKLQEMLKDIKKRNNNIKAVIAWRCDRVVRNNDDYYSEINRLFNQSGVLLLSATENNDVHTPIGKYMRGITMLNAELESDMNSIRVTENLKEKARQGYFPGSKPPVGYKRITENNKKIIVPDPEKVYYIKRLFELYSTGDYSWETLAQTMRAEGFMHNGKPCSRKLVENIMTLYPEFYIGKFSYMGNVHNNGVPYEGKHEPIIDLNLYSMVQDVRKRRERPVTRKHNFIYKGLITCKHTGKTFTAERQTGAHNSGIYDYYKCFRCDQCDKRGCKKTLKASVVDEAIMEALKTLEITPAQLNDIKEDLKVILNYQSEFDERKRQQVEIELTKNRNRLNKIYEDKLDGTITAETYNNMRDKCQNSIDDLTIQYNALNKTNQELIKRLEKMFELCKDLPAAYLRHNDLEKREILKILCSNLFYDGSKIVITIREPFEALLKFAVLYNGGLCRPMLELFVTQLKEKINPEFMLDLKLAA